MSTPASLPRDRLATPVRDFMRPGVIMIPEHASLLQAKRAMVRHGTHAVLVAGSSDGRPLGWVTANGLLSWLERDLSRIKASHAITEPPRLIGPDDTGTDALNALSGSQTMHLLVSSSPDGPALGVVAPIDLVDLVTRP